MSYRLPQAITSRCLWHHITENVINSEQEEVVMVPNQDAFKGIGQIYGGKVNYRFQTMTVCNLWVSEEEDYLWMPVWQSDNMMHISCWLLSKAVSVPVWGTRSSARRAYGLCLLLLEASGLIIVLSCLGLPPICHQGDHVPFFLRTCPFLALCPRKKILILLLFLVSRKNIESILV